jgi:ClpP class serine protease
VGTLATYYRPGYVLPRPIDKDTLLSAAQAHAGIQAIFAQDDKYNRVKRGLHAWRRAEQEYDAHYRLHQFVRAIEALIKPGRWARQLTEKFIHRAQFFTGHSSAAKELVSAFYELRSAAEHMYELEPILTTKLQNLCSKYPTYTPEKIITLLSYQAELLASYAYYRILKDASLQNIFIDDDSISRFWDQTDDIIRNTWVETIDLEAVLPSKDSQENCC